MVDETTTATAPKKRAAPVGEKAVRVPVELLERAVRLVPKLQATPWGDALRWNETALVRLALSRGLAVLEDELADDLERAATMKAPIPAARPKKPRGRG